MKNLDARAANSAGAAGGVSGYFDAAAGSVVITDLNVLASGTTQPNTLQAAIYTNGTIEIIVGALAPTGPSYAPGILGTIGIVAGGTRTRELASARPIRFSSLRGRAPAFMSFGPMARSTSSW
jgi:hypothetical protein